ncbi:hypothetical protein B0H14DRAFT_2784377 [Mycena olivaceomarginata]|nr:hypothetical protein B0H14DRAFT_2784377 [Mycena olivaceomarginata]
MRRWCAQPRHTPLFRVSPVYVARRNRGDGYREDVDGEGEAERGEDHGEDALPIHAPSCESAWPFGSEDANGCDVDMGRACVRIISLASMRATGEWDAEERVGFAAHGDAAKAARDRSSSSSSSSSSPSLSMRSMLLPPALHGHLPGLGHA